MPPAHIFCMRHAEQMAASVPNYRQSSPRPHDSALSDEGSAMAQALGTYLVHHYHIDPAHTIIFSSPLLRCVQTAHGVVQAMLAASAAAAAAAAVDGAETADHGEMRHIPIYIEPAFIESAHWIFHHMKYNSDLVHPSTGVFCCPDPVYYDAAYHKEHTSPHVELTHPLADALDPQFTIRENKLVDDTFPQRCDAAAMELLRLPALDGAIVLVVGHAETAPRVMHALTGTPFLDFHEGLECSAFVHLMCSGGEAATQVMAESEVFSSPHLSPHAANQ